MNRRRLIILTAILSLLVFYEIFNNQTSLLLITIGIISIILNKYSSTEQKNRFLLIGIILVLLGLLSNRIVFILFFIGILWLIGENPKIFNFFRENFIENFKDDTNNEFIMIDFEKTKDNPPKISRNTWFGNDNETENDIYSWEDVNYSKIAGNTVFDLGNTILPKEQNIIIMRKAFGNTKIIVPEGVAISLDISVGLGEIKINQDKITLKNETFKWYSTNYQSSSRKIKVVSNHLFGEIEVVFV